MLLSSVCAVCSGDTRLHGQGGGAVRELPWYCRSGLIISREQALRYDS